MTNPNLQGVRALTGLRTESAGIACAAQSVLCSVAVAHMRRNAVQVGALGEKVVIAERIERPLGIGREIIICGARASHDAPFADLVMDY